MKHKGFSLKVGKQGCSIEQEPAIPKVSDLAHMLIQTYQAKVLDVAISLVKTGQCASEVAIAADLAKGNLMKYIKTLEDENGTTICNGRQ